MNLSGKTKEMLNDLFKDYLYSTPNDIHSPFVVVKNGQIKLISNEVRPMSTNSEKMIVGSVGGDGYIEYLEIV